MHICVNEQGVNAFRIEARSLQFSVNEIISLTKRLQTISDQYMGTLGPHKESLDGALEQIMFHISQVSNAVNQVAELLEEIADAYNDVITNNRFTENHVVGGSSNRGGISGGNEASAVSTGDASTFDGMATGKLQNGDSLIKGDNYEKFISDYYRSEESSYESLSDSYVTEIVAPSQIEGIHLGDTEVQDPNVFWGMHSSSKDFFIETASQIPAVKEALARGQSLDEIKQDPILGTCATLYFDPRNMPRVEKNNGYYSFEGDGRHRIIAARELGFDIPVRVIGVRHYN